MPEPPISSITPKWVFWSTRQTVDKNIPSVVAIIETLISVACYWYLAVYFETYLILLVSVAVSPLLLLRTTKSTIEGVQIFIRTSRFFLKKARIMPRYAIVILSSVVAIFSPAFCLLLFILGFANLVSDHRLRISFNVLAFLAFFGPTMAAISIRLFRRVTQSYNSDKDLPNITNRFRTILGFLAFPSGIALILLSIYSRFFGTIRHVHNGIQQFPDNFRKLILCTSPSQRPEFMPGLHDGITIEGFGPLTWGDIVEYLSDFRRIGSYSEHLRIDGEISTRDFITLRIILVVHLFYLLVYLMFMFIPAWIYRFTLKSTAWIWWPLAFLGDDLKHARNPLLFHLKNRETLFSNVKFFLSLFAIIIFILGNTIIDLLSKSIASLASGGGGSISNPYLTVLGYAFIADWDLPPWQWVWFCSLLMSVVVTFWIDKAGRMYRHALSEKDGVLKLKVENEFGMIERFVRARKIMFTLYCILAGVHALIYFNKLECWVRVPINVERWAVWLYGQKMPIDRCIHEFSEIIL